MVIGPTNIILTKSEVRSLQRWYPYFTLEKVKYYKESRGKTISDILLVPKGLGKLNTKTGLPYVQVIGVTPDRDFYDLGRSGVCQVNVGVTIDSYGKNITHISGLNWVVKDNFEPWTTLILTSTEIKS